MLPVISPSPWQFKLILLILYTFAALVINFRPVGRLLILILVALLTLLPLLGLIQGAACWSSGSVHTLDLIYCAAGRSSIVLDVMLLSSVLLLIIGNEWRGTLPATVNGMYLPRSVRFIAIVSGAMIGEFQRAVTRVHQAFTGRGQALPTLNWRNAVMLPKMLAVVWAAVLTGAALRLDEQWASDGFWAQHVPTGNASLPVISVRDILTLCVCLFLGGYFIVKSIL